MIREPYFKKPPSAIICQISRRPKGLFQAQLLSVDFSFQMYSPDMVGIWNRNEPSGKATQLLHQRQELTLDCWYWSDSKAGDVPRLTSSLPTFLPGPCLSSKPASLGWSKMVGRTPPNIQGPRKVPRSQHDTPQEMVILRSCYRSLGDLLWNLHSLPYPMRVEIGEPDLCNVFPAGPVCLDIGKW